MVGLGEDFVNESRALPGDGQAGAGQQENGAAARAGLQAGQGNGREAGGTAGVEEGVVVGEAGGERFRPGGAAAFNIQHEAAIGAGEADDTAAGQAGGSDQQEAEREPQGVCGGGGEACGVEGEFFATGKAREQGGGRRYVGLTAPGGAEKAQPGGNLAREGEGKVEGVAVILLGSEFESAGQCAEGAREVVAQAGAKGSREGQRVEACN